jgi:bifunctional non-homologous end joining protein LigD
MPKKETRVLELAGREVTVSNPSKVYFPEAGITKGELVDYYLAVADGALRGVARRPMNLKRFVDGIGKEPFFQKRVPDNKPDWVDTAVYTFPSGRHAEEICVSDVAQLIWVVNLGCIDLNPHPIRKDDMEHPDELRIDLDPVPGVEWPQILEVAKVVKQTLDDLGLTGWPKTSGSRGIHVWVRIRPEWPFQTVRRAAVALAREVARRAPEIATAKWWKEERRGVFLDYNQNARDRTTASAYSVRPTKDARVSMPLSWKQLFQCDPHDYTLKTVPKLFAKHGDAHEGIDEKPDGLEALLELAKKQEAEGEVEAPLPPHFAKEEGEAPRVAPSRARKPKVPVITIAQAKEQADALAGFERWKAKYPKVIPHLAAKDILVDKNRGRSTVWYRVRINLESVPPEDRPPQETPDPDYDPRSEWAGFAVKPSED